MKKLLLIIGILGIATSVNAAAPYVFQSSSEGYTPVAGYYLQTDGTVSTWAPVTGGGGGGDSVWSRLTTTGLIYTPTTTDAVSIGGNSTTSAATEFWFDPGLLTNGIAYIKGRLGIGTTSPYALLSVAGETVSGWFTGTSTTQANTFPLASTSILTAPSAYITKLSNLTGNGFVKTASSDGTLSVDTTTYLSAVTADSPLSGSGTSASHLTISTAGTWSGNAGTASALAANPTNCSAGSYPLGIDASGNVENCTVAGTGGGTGNVGTSSVPTIGNLSYWTTDTATPALLGKVATSSLAIGASLSNTGTLGSQVGGTNSSLSLNMANANTWTALQTFGNASTTQIGSTGNAYFATAGGNVGIGTTSPFNALSNTSYNIVDQSAVGTIGSGGSGISWRSKAAGYGIGLVNDSVISNAMGLLVNIAGTASTNKILTLNSGGTDRLTVLGNGNVGIGTTSPVKLLSLQSTSDPQILFTNSSNNRTASFGVSDTFNSVVSAIGGGAITFNIDNSIKALVNIDGNVGIGTTTPYGRLSVTGAGITTGVNLQLADSANTPIMTMLDNGTLSVDTITATGTVVGNWQVNGDSTLSSLITGPITLGPDAGAVSAVNASLSTEGVLDSVQSLCFGWCDVTETGTSTLTLYGLHAGTSGSLRGFAVGIATTTPGAKLSIEGSANPTMPLVLIASTSPTFATTTVFGIDSNGIINTKYGIYCEIFVSDASVAQSITNGTTYTKSTALSSTTLTSTKYCSPSATNQNITITQPGKYRVSGTFSFFATTNNVKIIGAVFADGIEQNNIHFKRKLGTAADVGNAGFTGFITATSSTVVDLRLRHDQGSPENVTVEYGNLNVEYIGGIQGVI